jgi:predicted Zn-dependent peptidase
MKPWTALAGCLVVALAVLPTSRALAQAAKGPRAPLPPPTGKVVAKPVTVMKPKGLAKPPVPPAAVAASSGSAAMPKLEFEKYVLENGLEVILHEDHRTPVVAVNVWYHVGSKDEAPGKNGFAHLFEHVMFQGSRHVAEDTFFKYLERAGASERNGTTSTDRTNYFETVPQNELSLALWLESDRMAFLLDHAGEETFKSQREVVKNERRQNYENAPYGLVTQFIFGALFPKTHPYNRLTIGTPEDLDAATLPDVQAFFRRYYVPNNATLVLAGDFEKAKAKELVAQYFGPIVKGKAPEGKNEPMPVTLDQETTLQVEASVALPRIVLTWPSPPAFAKGDAELDVLSNVLSSGKTSRLQKRLVRDLKVAQDVAVHQSSMQLASTFQIIVTVREGKNVQEVAALVDEEIAKLQKTAPADAEFGRAKADLLSQLVFGVEKVTARADALNRYNQMAKNPDYLGKDTARYEAVTPADVQQAATTYLPLDRRIRTFVNPVADAPRAGRLVAGK